MLAVVVSSLLALLGRGRPRFPYLAQPLPEATYAALAAEPGWARTALEVAPGVKLNGLIRRASSKTAPWILFYPGNDESQLERGQSFLRRLAQDLDYGLALYAARGYDSSSGKPAMLDLTGDAPQILARLCATEGLEPARVHLVGFSIGGFLASVAARSSAQSGHPARSLTLLASVNDIVMVQPSRWQRVSPGEHYETTPILSGVPAPVLVLQGTTDEAFEGPGEGRAIAKVLGNRASYHELPGVGHVSLLKNEPALALVRAFLAEHSR